MIELTSDVIDKIVSGELREFGCLFETQEEAADACEKACLGLDHEGLPWPFTVEWVVTPSSRRSPVPDALTREYVWGWYGVGRQTVKA